jgi:hypothetical protein
MMSHDQMMNNGTYRSGARGLHYFGGQMIAGAAAEAARAVFEACDGKSTGWKSWLHPSGRMIRTCYGLMTAYLDQRPNMGAAELFAYLLNFPCDGERIPYSNGNMWEDKTLPWSWEAAPGAVRAAYEAYRHVYLNLWVIARTHNEAMAQALAPRPAPRLISDTDEPEGGNVVRLPDADGAA